MRPYTVTYSRVTVCGEKGWWYRVWIGERLVIEGWQPGQKRNAYAEAHEGINAREALRSAAGAA